LREEAAQELLARRRARQHLIDFACYVDPAAKQWYSADHLRAIAEALERVEHGDLRRLVVSVPPRHWKSSLASEKFPAWWLGKNPNGAVIVVSYALSLAEKFSKTVRSTLDLPAYRAIFPNVRIKRDSNRADDWLLETGIRSSFRAVGVGGGVTGHGAGLIVLDDVIDPAEARSETMRESVWTWYRQVLRTRLEPGGSIVIVNTRAHAADLIGKLLDSEKDAGGEHWEYINISAARPGGAYLWTDRFPASEYEALQQDPYTWRTQYLGETSTAEGSEIKREWFELLPALPEGATEQCRAWDLALTLKSTQKSDPDYTASVGSAMHGGWLYLISPTRTRAELPTILSMIENHKKSNPHVREGMARDLAAKAAQQMLLKSGVYIEEYEEAMDLRARLAPFIHWCARRLVKLVGTKEEWEQFLDEATAFPLGKHDDLLAVCAGLTQMHGLAIRMPKPKADEKKAKRDWGSFQPAR